MHNVDCDDALWSISTTYDQYDEVRWPSVSYPDMTCNFYSTIGFNTGQEPDYTTVKGNVTMCNTTVYWVSKGLCDEPTGS